MASAWRLHLPFDEILPADYLLCRFKCMASGYNFHISFWVCINSVGIMTLIIQALAIVLVNPPCGLYWWSIIVFGNLLSSITLKRGYTIMHNNAMSAMSAHRYWAVDLWAKYASAGPAGFCLNLGFEEGWENLWKHRTVWILLYELWSCWDPEYETFAER